MDVYVTRRGELVSVTESPKLRNILDLIVPYVSCIFIEFCVPFLIAILLLGHCPSGNDPITTKNETDCYNVTDSSGRGVGEYGNLCHVDCSNRGICDYETGSCKCFSGFAGPNCGYYSTVMRDGSIDESDPAILKASVYRSAEQTGYHWINPV